MAEDASSKENRYILSKIPSSLLGEMSPDILLLVAGDSGSGKSTILLQTTEYCASRGWFVVYVPRGNATSFLQGLINLTGLSLAIEWVNSTSSLQYDAKSQMFLQTSRTSELLQKILTFNRAVADSISLPEAVTLDKSTIPANSPFSKLLEAGIADPSEAPSALRSALDVLSKQSK